MEMGETGPKYVLKYAQSTFPSDFEKYTLFVYGARREFQFDQYQYYNLTDTHYPHISMLHFDV